MTHDDIEKLTDKQVVELIQMDTPLSKARRALEQNLGAMAANPTVDIITKRKMEFKTIIAIAKELGVKV